MKIPCGRILWACLALCLGAVPTAARGVKNPVRLLVIISVDQMRADYLDRFHARPTGGFSRLLKESAVFTDAHHGHIPLYTAPGHAAIMTGRWPAEHGIVGNKWYDRKEGKTTAVTDKLFGPSPHNLLAYTLGDALKSADSKSKVVSVAGKDRAAILMGGKRADRALWYDRKSGNFTTSRYYGSVPVWTRLFNKAERLPGPRGEKARKVLTHASELDRLTLRLALLALQEEELGRDKHPDILTIGLSATDFIGHRRGPTSPDMDRHLEKLDKYVGELMTSLDDRLGRDGYALILTADHGVLPRPESPAGKAMGARRVSLKKFRKQAEAALRKKWPLPADSTDRWILKLYPPHVYLNRQLAKKRGLDPAQWLKEAAQALAGFDFVAAVFRSDRLALGLGGSHPAAEAFVRSYYAPRAGDLLLLIKEKVLLKKSKKETGHGLPYPYDTHVPLIFHGPGILPGEYHDRALILDLAPTAGQLIGIDYAPADGARVRTEIFFR